MAAMDDRIFKRARAAFAPLFFLAGALGAAHAQDTKATPGRLRIETISSAPEYVSGGDALVRIEVPAGMSARDVRVELGGVNVSDVFRADGGDRALVGLVTGLKVGRNTLTAKAGGAS